MYAKIFSQILDSSIARDPNLRRMFQDLLILADSDGVVDMTFFAISQRLVIPEDEIRLQIDKLCKPDPQSRSKNDDGRRLIKIDESREWGWLIVNYVKYANTRDEDSRKKQVREAVARHRAKKPPSISTSCNRDVINVITNDYSNHDVITVSHGKPIHTTDVSVPVSTNTELATTTASPKMASADSAPSLSSQIEVIYQAYPRKVGKAVALKAIAKAIQNGNTYAVLLDAVQEFAMSPAGKAGQFCPHPATWFNRESFKDDRREWKRDRYSDSVSAATKHSEGFADDLADVPTQHCPIAQCASPILTGLRADEVPY